MDEGRRLDELFRALFTTDAELRRFLVLLGLSVGELLGPATKSRSRSTTSAEVARALDERGLISRELFDALEKRAPDRGMDIRAVQSDYLGDATRDKALTDKPGASRTRPRTPRDSMEVSAGLADFAESLRAELASGELPEAASGAMSPSRWPWTGAAAVLGSFRPTDLKPLAPSPVGTSALTALADVVVETISGRWVLRNEVRSQALERLYIEGRLEEALDANGGLLDARRDLLRELVHGAAPALESLDARGLDDLAVVSAWLEPLGVNQGVSSERILAAVERRQLIDPLRALVGTHFRGRVKELEVLREHISGATQDVGLLIGGAGGAGKSTLIGRVLLDLEERAYFVPVPFAYVDFDKARNDPRRPEALLEQIARQLRLLYANAATATEFAAYESYAGGTDIALASEILNIAPDLHLDELVKVLSGRLEEIRRSYGDAGAPPLVLVLDTYEEVHTKGPGAVRDVVDLMKRLWSQMPAMRFVVSGRGVPTGFHQFPTTEVRIGDLDHEAADAVLEHFGVEDEGFRSLIIQRFGRNPLTLRLAAEAVARAGSAEDAFGGELARADILAHVALEHVQGMLYSRILGHIGDPEIAALAHPGLVVRRVTPDVIRQVLAVPCGLDPARADDIFERLRREVSMFEAEGPEALRHRQDVRRLMLRTMLDEPDHRAQAEEIHRRAIAYYAGRRESGARAEELYHGLVSGEDPRKLSELWTRDMESSLASALDEPLPPAARRWLERRLGIVPPNEQEEWDQEDWEASAASRASSWLASSDPQAALSVLSERSERLPASRLYPLEVAAHLEAGDVAKAADVLALGLSEAIESDDRSIELELAEQAIRVRAREGDSAGVVKAVRTATVLCDLNGQRERAILALADGVEQLHDLRADTDEIALASELTKRFTRMTRDEMHDHPEVVRRAMETAGRMDSAVLVHAALQVGDETDTASAVFNDDAFLVQRLLDEVSQGGMDALSTLAAEVGLDPTNWDVQELASHAVRTGRLGKAIALGLDYAEDDSAARDLVTEQLIRPDSAFA